MQIKDLKGAMLDYWVARAEGLKAEIKHRGHSAETCWTILPNGVTDYHFTPSTSWAQGGPIIEREEISLLPGPWSAQVFLEDGLRSFEGTGSTPLVAAMRAYVASKFGDEVPDLQA